MSMNRDPRETERRVHGSGQSDGKIRESYTERWNINDVSNTNSFKRERDDHHSPHLDVKKICHDEPKNRNLSEIKGNEDLNLPILEKTRQNERASSAINFTQDTNKRVVAVPTYTEKQQISLKMTNMRGTQLTALNCDQQQQHNFYFNLTQSPMVPPAIISALVPPEYPYVIRKSDYPSAGIKFGIDLDLSTKDAFFLWLQRHEVVSGVKYSPVNIKVNPSQNVDFKGLYQCTAHVTVVDKQRETRTPCLSKLRVTILCNCSSKNKALKSFATMVTIEFNHKHPINTNVDVAVEEKQEHSNLISQIRTVENLQNPQKTTTTNEKQQHLHLPQPLAFSSVNQQKSTVTEKQKTSNSKKPDNEVEIVTNKKPLPEVIDLIDDDDDEIPIRDLLLTKVKKLQDLRASELKVDVICVGKVDFRIGIMFLSTLQHAVKNCRLLLIHRVKIFENFDVVVVSVQSLVKKFPFIIFVTSTDALNLSTVLLKDCQDAMSTNGLNVDNVEVVITDMPYWKLQISKTFPNAVVSTSIHSIMFDVWCWLWKRQNATDIDDIDRCSLFSVICQLFNSSNRKYFDSSIYSNVLRNNYMKKCSKFREYFTNEIQHVKDHVFTSEIDNKNTVDVVSDLLLNDLIILIGCMDDLMSFLDFLMKYSPNQNDTFDLLEEKRKFFDIVDVNQNYCSIGVKNSNILYTVDKKFGFCSCSRGLEGWSCVHRKFVLSRQFRLKLLGDANVQLNQVKIKQPLPIPPQNACTISVVPKIPNLSPPKPVVKVEPLLSKEVQPSKEETKKKLSAVVDKIMSKWNDDSKLNIANAVEKLYENCSSMSPKEICSHLSKI